MNTLQAIIDEIRTVRDSEASRRLCLDCWSRGTSHGEAEGIAWARNVLAGVRAYVAYENRIQNKTRMNQS